MVFCLLLPSVNYLFYNQEKNKEDIHSLFFYQLFEGQNFDYYYLYYFQIKRLELNHTNTFNHSNRN